MTGGLTASVSAHAQIHRIDAAVATQNNQGFPLLPLLLTKLKLGALTIASSDVQVPAWLALGDVHVVSTLAHGLILVG